MLKLEIPNIIKPKSQTKKRKKKSKRNKTLRLSTRDLIILEERLHKFTGYLDIKDCVGKTFNQDFFEAIPFFPKESVDLIILDPPYNLNKKYNNYRFKKQTEDNYTQWFESIIIPLKGVLKPSGSIYVCSDWKTSILIAPVLQKHFCINNRITWEREKGRAAKLNWKNCMEDIWFCSMDNKYHFDMEAVQLKKEVRTPYRDKKGNPKDWAEELDGFFRFTAPSNLWTDITVPFWSMPENTNHPTQKPEKLIAKLILASTGISEVVFDPFMGSGTTSVVARKLKRKYIGIEQDHEYCLYAEKRLEEAKTRPHIQGYVNKIFWERNALGKFKNAF